jgi:superfamily II DNA/RNA helicase
LPWDEDDGGDLGLPDTVLALAGLSDQTKEVTWLEQLVSLAQAAAGASSKVAFLKRLLRRTTESLIVFSEYRDVVAHVASHLAELTTVTVLHGGLSSFARTNSIQSFLDGRARVLITTDAAGEGLNLHGRCRFVINLELPWNPLRIEQRVGRVDRLGQTRRVHARHLYYRGSFEELVLTRLTQRRDVAAGVLEGREVDCLCEPLPNENGSVKEHVGSPLIERRLKTLAARSKGPQRSRRPIYSWSSRRRTPRAKATLVFAADLVDLSGRLVQREIIPLEIHGLSTSLCTAKRALTKLADDRRVRAAVDGEIARRLALATAAVKPAAASYERRVAALAAGIARRRSARLYQGSLFDRRAEQQSHAHGSAIATWVAHLEHRLEAARALRQIRAERSRLVAAWSDPVAP